MTPTAKADQKSNPEPSNVSYSRILVAVDYLESTPEIFEQALELAKLYDSEMMIFHCLQEEVAGMPEIVAYSGMGAYGGIYSSEMVHFREKLVQETTQQLLEWLGGFVRKAESVGIKAYSDYAIGLPGHKICEIAENWPADLIVIGRRGRSGLSELVLGSISNYVIHHAPCSVLVIQHPH